MPKAYLFFAVASQHQAHAALVQSNKAQIARKQLIFSMNSIAKKKPKESIEKEITGYDIAGANARWPGSWNRSISQ
jgi:hypothetical protein